MPAFDAVYAYSSMFTMRRPSTLEMLMIRPGSWAERVLRCSSSGAKACDVMKTPVTFTPSTWSWTPSTHGANFFTTKNMANPTCAKKSKARQQTSLRYALTGHHQAAATRIAITNPSTRFWKAAPVHCKRRG